MRHELESETLGENVVLQVYLPYGYDDDGSERYAVAYYHDGEGALARGQLPTSLDNLLGTEVRPIVAVFVQPERAVFFYGDRYVNSLAEELVPFIDANYRTIPEPKGRASVGGGFMGVSALEVGLKKPDIFGKVAAQSVWWPGDPGRITQLVRTPAEQPLDLYVEWGTYDMKSPDENWDMGVVTRTIVDSLVSHGHTVAGGEVPDGAGWSSWKNRTDRVLRSLFPLE